MVIEGDVAAVTVHGATDGNDIRKMLEIYDGIVAQHGRYACLVFCSQMEQFPPEARRLLAEWPHAHSCYAIAVVGASFAVRTVIGLFVRALHLLRLSKAPTEFFKTEAEARAFQQKCRQQAAAVAPSKSAS